jgi:hypothetical protein
VEKNRILNEDVISTRVVCRRLGIGVSVDFLRSCGLIPVIVNGKTNYWRLSDVPLMCVAIAKNLSDRASGILREPYED